MRVYLTCFGGAAAVASGGVGSDRLPGTVVSDRSVGRGVVISGVLVTRGDGEREAELRSGADSVLDDGRWTMVDATSGATARSCDDPAPSAAACPAAHRGLAGEAESVAGDWWALSGSFAPTVAD